MGASYGCPLAFFLVGFRGGREENKAHCENTAVGSLCGQVIVVLRYQGPLTTPPCLAVLWRMSVTY